MSLSLQPPESVSGEEFFSSNFLTLLLFHAALLTALIPELFSWTGVTLVLVGNYVFGTLGVNLGFHRLLTHRSFRCPKWLEYSFAILGVCSLQDSPARWVAIHRMHHKHSDERPDPHSPLVSLFWGHLGWLLIKNRDLRKRVTLERYTKDLMQDRFYARLEKHRLWLWIYLAHASLFFVAGTLAGWVMSGTTRGALQFGLSVFVWGVVVRTVFVWHVTWTVNSVAHRWGYRNYETDDNSRNSWIVALLTSGEGWHNNHHACQRSARHGHRWWEIDLTYLTILFLRAIGLAEHVVIPHIPARFHAGHKGPGEPFVPTSSSGPSDQPPSELVGREECSNPVAA